MGERERGVEVLLRCYYLMEEGKGIKVVALGAKISTMGGKIVKHKVLVKSI